MTDASLCRSQQDLHARHSNTPEAGHLTANGQPGRWEAALGNVEDARLATDLWVPERQCPCTTCPENLPQGYQHYRGSCIVPDQNLGQCRLSRAVDDAVYLDEDAYHQVQPKVAYLKTIQVRSDPSSIQLQPDVPVIACITTSASLMKRCGAMAPQAQQGRIATLTMEQQELQKHLAAAENVRQRSDQQVCSLSLLPSSK